MSEKADNPASRDAVNGAKRRIAATAGNETSNLHPVEAPFYYASNVQIFVTGNEANLLFTRRHPTVLPDGKLSPTHMHQPVALIAMSFATLKGLSKAAADIMGRVEERTS